MAVLKDALQMELSFLQALSMTVVLQIVLEVELWFLPALAMVLA